jgi:hypothetical protein
MTPIETTGPELQYTMKTWVDDKVLHTEMQCAMDSITATIQKWASDTRATQVRQALEKLGWLAPGADIQDAMMARCARCRHYGSENAGGYDACTGCIGHFPLPDRFKEKA